MCTRKRSSVAYPLLHRGDGIVVERGELRDVVALVAVGRRALPPSPGIDRCVEQVDLRARVVDVELALDGVAGEIEEARDRVPVRGVPHRRDGERPGRVRRDELDLHLLGLGAGAAPVVGSGLEDLRERLSVPARVELEIDEAGRCDGRVQHAREAGCHHTELLGDLHRRLASHGSGAQGRIRGVVAMLGVGRALELDGDAETVLQSPLEPFDRLGRHAAIS